MATLSRDAALRNCSPQGFRPSSPRDDGAEEPSQRRGASLHGRLGFEDLGIIVMPLLVLLFYRLMPVPEDFEDTNGLRTGLPTEEVGALLDEAPQPRQTEVTAGQAPAGSALVRIAPLVALGFLGYIIVMLFRGVGIPRRS